MTPTINYSTTNTATSAFIVNALVFESLGFSSANSSAVNLSSTAAGGGISFQGVNPRITQNGTGLILFSNGAATNDLQLTASGLTIDGSGLGSVVFNGAIAGTGNLTINHTGTTAGGTGGQIIINPASGVSNSFVGTVTLNNGNLTLGTGANPLGAPTNSLVINGGTLRGKADTVTVPNPITLNTTLQLPGPAEMIFAGAITGTGGIQMEGYHTFRAPVSAVGQIATSGTSSFNQVVLESTATTSGTMLSATGYDFTRTVLTLSNSVANATRLNASAAMGMRLRNSTVEILGNADFATAESVNTGLTITGSAEFVLTPTLSRPMSLSFGSLARDGGTATFLARTWGTNLTLGGTPGTPGNANLHFGGFSAADNVNGLLPFGIAGVQTSTGPASSLVRYDDVRGIVPFNRDTDYTTRHPALVGPAPGENLRISSSFGSLPDGKTLNSLLIETRSGSRLGTTLLGTGTVTLTSGVLAAGVYDGFSPPFLLDAVLVPNLALNGTRGHVHAVHSLTLTGSISGTAGLVKAGPGVLQLLADNSQLTGGISISQGSLRFISNENLGAPGQPIRNSGGLQYLPTDVYQPLQNSHVTVNRPMILGGGGGDVSAWYSGASLNYTGEISGQGPLWLHGAGKVILGPANSYTGDTVIGGTVSVAGDGSFGNAAGSVYLSGILVTDSNYSTNRNLFLSSVNGATIVTNGNTVTWNGVIAGTIPDAPFVKAGDGTLILTATNSFVGRLTVGTGTTPLNSVGVLPPGGSLVLSGPAGALPGSTDVIVNWSTLHLDNSAGVNTNRLGTSRVTLMGGELRLTGNGNADVYEHIGITATNSLVADRGSTITLVQPPSGVANRAVTLFVSSYFTGGIGTALFRGDNLGGTTGDRSRVLFQEVPTLINGLVPGAVFSNSSTGLATDFAKYDATTGVGRYSAYTPFPASGSTTDTNYGLAGSRTLTQIGSGSALKLINGAINLNGFPLLLGGSTQAGMLLSTGNDSITTTTTTGEVAFANSPARIIVNNSLTIGSTTNRVRISGTAGLNKTGPGTLTLAGAEISGANIFISEGTLRPLLATTLPNSLFVAIGPTGTLDMQDIGTLAGPVRVRGFEGVGSVKLGNGVLAIEGSGGNYAGRLEGTGTLLLRSTADQTLSGNSPGFSGDVRLLNGTMSVNGNVIPGHLTAPGPIGSGSSPLLIGDASTTSVTLNVSGEFMHRDVTISSSIPPQATVVYNGTGHVQTLSGQWRLGHNLQIGTNQLSVLSATRIVTFTGSLVDGDAPGSLTWAGRSVNLHGANTYSGGTLLNGTPLSGGSGGILGIGSDSAFGTGDIVLANSYAFGYLRPDFGPRTISNTFRYAPGNIANVLGFVGSQDLTLTGPTWDLGSAVRTWELNGLGVTTVTGTLTQSNGTASLIKTGAGTLILGGASTFTGGFTLTEGVLGLQRDGTGTNGPVGTGTLTLSGGTLRAVGGARTVVNPTVISGNLAVDGGDSLTLSGPMNLGAAPRTMVILNTARTNFAGPIAATAGGIIKQGPGVLSLGGDNNYTGPTVVDGGTLLANNAFGSATGTGAVTVLGAARLGGTGRITGPTTLRTGATIAPGDGIGSLTLNQTLSMEPGAAFEWDIAAHTPASAAIDSGLSTNPLFHDQLAVNGSLTAGPFVLRINETGLPTFAPGQTYSWTIATVANGSTMGPVTFDLAAAPTFVANGGIDQLSVNLLAGQMYLNFTPVPESPFVLLLAASTLTVGTWLRKQTRRSQVGRRFRDVEHRM